MEAILCLPALPILPLEDGLGERASVLVARFLRYGLKRLRAVVGERTKSGSRIASVRAYTHRLGDTLGRTLAHTLGASSYSCSGGTEGVAAAEIVRMTRGACWALVDGMCFHFMGGSCATLGSPPSPPVLQFLGEEGTHIAYHGSMVGHGISTLVVRQYEQTTDDATKSHCLDLIDRMERVGYLGMGDELDRIDR